MNSKNYTVNTLWLIKQLSFGLSLTFFMIVLQLVQEFLFSSDLLLSRKQNCPLHFYVRTFLFIFRLFLFTRDLVC